MLLSKVFRVRSNSWMEMAPSHVFAISSDNGFSISKNSVKDGLLGSIFLDRYI